MIGIDLPPTVAGLDQDLGLALPDEITPIGPRNRGRAAGRDGDHHVLRAGASSRPRSVALELPRVEVPFPELAVEGVVHENTSARNIFGPDALTEGRARSSARVEEILAPRLRADGVDAEEVPTARRSAREDRVRHR